MKVQTKGGISVERKRRKKNVLAPSQTMMQLITCNCKKGLKLKLNPETFTLDLEKKISTQKTHELLFHCKRTSSILNEKKNNGI